MMTQVQNLRPKFIHFPQIKLIMMTYVKNVLLDDSMSDDADKQIKERCEDVFQAAGKQVQGFIGVCGCNKYSFFRLH